MSEYLLGVNFGHDATVVLMKDGEIVEAMMEERITRVKKYIGFPHEALAYLIKKYGIENFRLVFIDGMDLGLHITNTKQDVIEYRNRPTQNVWFMRAVIDRIPLSGLLYTINETLNSWRLSLKNPAGVVQKFLAHEFPGAEIVNMAHHDSHAWASIPLLDDVRTRRLILILDGEGDTFCGSINLFENGDIKVLHRFARENSLGLLYASFVDLLGMSRNEHEFKVMGLAPYAKKSSGEKVYEKLKELIWFDEDTMQLVATIDMRRATPYLIAHDYHQHRFDSLAYGIQKLTEEIIKDLARASIKKYGCFDIVVGGGVFMNVKANQYLSEMKEVRSLVVMPSGGDESIAIGDVVHGYAKLHDHDLSGLKKINNLYLGSEYSDEEIKKVIDEYEFCKHCDVEYFDPKSEITVEKKVAELLANNSVVGRLKGRSEWGARALGNRSILANPSSRDNVKLINEMIKGRDFWMPFATSMLYERRHDYLVLKKDEYAPFMAITFPTKELAHTELIAALHPYDLTSRPQMVKKDVNPDYHALITHYETLTGSGGILNTSFNLHGEPNVETPEDALRTFEHSGLPHVALGNYLISKRS
ncbi:MAG: carbamoyltransferase C-terminal domain-containing protein [Candidatus Paceibacterota bacterium]